MKTEWDYTSLADAYLKRPDYSDAALQALFHTTHVQPGELVCDIGAGTAHLTRKLLAYGLRVHAVEPNDAMRRNGMDVTKNEPNVTWFEGTGENTGQADHIFDLVTFGSSFNVVDHTKTFPEIQRILKPKGWFACMWNHRNLNDPIQAEIEGIIQRHIANYDYGLRRAEQTDLIHSSGLFGEVFKIEGTISHQQSLEDCIEAWRSHGTLARQAGPAFATIIDAIESYLRSLNQPMIPIPYTTRIWTAQLRD